MGQGVRRMRAEIVFEGLGMAHQFVGFALVAALPNPFQTAVAEIIESSLDRRGRTSGNLGNLFVLESMSREIEDVHSFLDLWAGVHESIMFDLVPVILGKYKRSHSGILDTTETTRILTQTERRTTGKISRRQYILLLHASFFCLVLILMFVWWPFLSLYRGLRRLLRLRRS